jgi:hypothetical protein
MVESTWTAYIEGQTSDDLALLRRFRELADAAGPEVEMTVSKTVIAWRRDRTFALAYLKNHYLEAAVDLLRETTHPALRTAFATTKKVTTHRLTISRLDQLDSALKKLLAEAYETVGPGTR